MELRRSLNDGMIVRTSDGAVNKIDEPEWDQLLEAHTRNGIIKLFTMKLN